MNRKQVTLFRALTAAEVKEIPTRFISSEWYLDENDLAVLITWQRFGDVWIKVVIRMDRRVGKADVIANEIVTAGAVKDVDMQAERYKKL